MNAIAGAPQDAAPFIPYSHQSISEDDIAAVLRVLQSDFLTQGEVLPAFEAAFAKRHQVAHAVAVSNATCALHIACLALDFVDIDPASRNMSLAALEAKLQQAQADNRLPQLLIPVDFAGWPCDLREMRTLADRYGFRILEDASHAVAARYCGRPVGSAWATFMAPSSRITVP